MANYLDSWGEVIERMAENTRARDAENERLFEEMMPHNVSLLSGKTAEQLMDLLVHFGSGCAPTAKLGRLYAEYATHVRAEIRGRMGE